MKPLHEDEIRLIAEAALRQLGNTATPENIDKVVRETVKRLSDQSEQQEATPAARRAESSMTGNRIIVTAFGKNSMGILAGLTGALAEMQCDIVDLSQKILKEFFTIMLLVDISHSQFDFETIKNRLVQAGERFNLKVITQHEQIFKTMHRI